jgi:hypothetical protein
MKNHLSYFTAFTLLLVTVGCSNNPGQKGETAHTTQIAQTSQKVETFKLTMPDPNEQELPVGGPKPKPEDLAGLNKPLDPKLLEREYYEKDAAYKYDLTKFVGNICLETAPGKFEILSG